MLAAPILPLLCSREDFEFAVSEVLKQHEAALYPAACGAGLTSEERALLIEGGADLEAHVGGEDDPVVRTAAKHAAILASPVTMIHAVEGAPVAEVPYGRWWRRRVAGVFSFQGLDD